MDLNTFEIGLLALLLFCFIARLLFSWVVMAKPYYYMKSATKNKSDAANPQPPVSVIICLRSSTHDIYRFLPDILEQDYPEFEVIVVTDGISDADEEALKRMMTNYPNLYSTHVPDDTRNVSRKKLALTLGIKAAKYDKLLFTEPDCRIRTNDWIYLMARHFSDNKSIVLGLSVSDNSAGNSNNFSFRYMEYDYFVSNLQMISFALFKHPYAGNGRNMAYTKEHFKEQKGFVKHRTLQHGEDDLFINEIANGENTVVELSPRSITFTEILDYHEWKHLKTDRISTERFYKRGPIAFRRLEMLLRILFYATVINCFISRLSYESLFDLLLPGIALFCLLIYFLSLIIIIDKTCRHLQLGKFNMTVLLFDLFQPFVNFYFYIYQTMKVKDNYTYHYEKR